MWVCFFVCMYVFVRMSDSWIWRYNQVWAAALWVLGIEPRSFGRSADAHKCRAIAPAPKENPLQSVFWYKFLFFIYKEDHFFFLHWSQQVTQLHFRVASSEDFDTNLWTISHHLVSPPEVPFFEKYHDISLLCTVVFPERCSLKRGQWILLLKCFPGFPLAWRKRGVTMSLHISILSCSLPTRPHPAFHTCISWVMMSQMAFLTSTLLGVLAV